jgi:hypothetical protein
MDTIPEEGWSGKLVEKTMAGKQSVFEEDFPGVQQIRQLLTEAL